MEERQIEFSELISPSPDFHVFLFRNDHIRFDKPRVQRTVKSKHICIFVLIVGIVVLVRTHFVPCIYEFRRKTEEKKRKKKKKKQ